ncbi:MAG: methyltransferase domain-containing protein [Candidatus Omnitrophota bacterium]
MIDAIKIRRAFSKVASGYDKNSFLQQSIGVELLDNLKLNKIYPKRVLDIGMGTGWLCEKIAKDFNVHTFGIDSAFGMALFAKSRLGLISITAEAENLPFKNDSFDCIVSNLSFQWVFDLDKAFLEVKRVLREGGIFYFTCFTKGTLSELKKAFLFTLNNKKDLVFFDLPDEGKIRNALKKSGLKFARLISRRKSEKFNDLFSILHWLKSVGANSVAEPVQIKRNDFLKANEYYRDNFKSNGEVYATFEVFEGCVVK